MSKEPEREMNGHAHSARDQTNQGTYTSPFFKGREKRSFQQSTSNGIILGPFIKKNDKKRSQYYVQIMYSKVQ